MSPNVCYPCPRSVHCRWGDWKRESFLCRSDFNHPPTAVGGIEERSSKIWSLLFMLTPHIPQISKLKLNLTITFQNQKGQSRDGSPRIIRIDPSHQCKSVVPFVPMLLPPI